MNQQCQCQSDDADADDDDDINFEYGSIPPLSPAPSTHVTVTLGGHSAVAEYDEDLDDDVDGGGNNGGGGGDGGGGVNNNPSSSSSSKFQWQNKLGSSHFNAENSSSSTSGGRTSCCYSARTRTVRRSCDPIFNEEFRFEVADDTLLQDEPLLFHVWDLTEGSSQ